MSEGAESIERELKFPDVDLDALRGRLIECEAERITASALEENQLFDRNNELAESDSLLRLRMDSQGTWLTFKGPARFEDGVKVRVEHETKVDDAAQLDSLMDRAAYDEFVEGL